MSNRTLAIRVPPDEARAYETASPEQQRQVDEVLRRRLRELMRQRPPVDGASEPSKQTESRKEIHPEVLKIAGLVPSDVDARAEYRDYLMKKHQ